MNDWQFYIMLNGLCMLTQFNICILYYLKYNQIVIWKCLLFNLFVWIAILLSIITIQCP